MKRQATRYNRIDNNFCTLFMQTVLRSLILASVIIFRHLKIKMLQLFQLNVTTWIFAEYLIKNDVKIDRSVVRCQNHF
jgi:hypothetical protein